MPYRYIYMRKKTLTSVFFLTKCHLRCTILILAKNSFCKCFLELKNTLVFTTWELISLKFVKNLSPLIVIFEEVQASSFVIGHDREGEENCSVSGGWLVASYIMSNLRINIKPVFIQSINNKTFWQFQTGIGTEMDYPRWLLVCNWTVAYVIGLYFESTVDHTRLVCSWTVAYIIGLYFDSWPH